MPLTVTAPSLSAQAAPAAKQDLGSKDVFLKMLVAQMKNQDPQNPADSTQMSSQLAQFNMVEQQISTNKYLEQIAGSSGASTNSLDMASAGYLGHTVVINQSEVQYSGTPTNFGATLAANADSVYVTMTDAAGSPVRTMTLPASPAGEVQIQWDGRDDNGVKVNTGAYQVSIQAFDVAGQAVAASTQRTGIVDAIRSTPSGVELVVNGTPTSLANISEVRL